MKITPDEEDENNGGFEGMDALAKAIETVLLKVKIKLIETTISVCHYSKESNKTNSLSIKINKIEFCDEMAKENVANEEENNEGEEVIIDHKECISKIFHLSDLRVELKDSSTSDDGDGSASCDGGIPIASAAGDVNVKIKMSEGVGPKLEVDVLIGAVHVLLYPQQLHNLVELINDIASQIQQSLVPVNNNGAESVYNRPIPHQAKKIIEIQLMEHIDRERKKKEEERELLQLDPWDIGGIQNRHTDNDDNDDNDDDEYYHSFEINPTTTTAVGATGYATIANRNNQLSHVELSDGVGLQQLSSIPHHHHKGHDDHSSSPDVSKYSLVVSGLTLAILEGNPIHTYPSDTSHDDDDDDGNNDMFDSVKSHMSLNSTHMDYCCIDEGGLDPSKYLLSLHDILQGIVNRGKIVLHQEQLGRVLPADHILFWMSAIRVNVTSDDCQMAADGTVASCEVMEFLYHNEANIPDIKPVSIRSLIQMFEDTKSSKPCIRFKSSTAFDTPSIDHKMEAVTSIQLNVHHIKLYIDITMMDRLHVILHPPLRNVTSLMTDSTYYKGGPHASNVIFNHSMVSSGRHKISIRFDTEHVGLSLRFPVADTSQKLRPPWYRSPLRDEVLYIDMHQITSSLSISLPHQRTTSANVTLQYAKVYLSMDGNEDNKILFLIIGLQDSDHNEFDLASLRFTYNQFDDSPLDDDVPLILPDSNGDDFDMQLPPTQPSPFSHKRDLYTGPAGKSCSGGSSSLNEEMVLPATHEELMSYKSYLCASSSIILSISLPSISLHISSNQFMETLYNRFVNDLFLWQPASPSSIERTVGGASMFYSSMDILQPAVTKEEKFKLCQSVLQEECDNIDESTNSLFEMECNDHTSSPTHMMISLNIDKGQASLYLPIKMSSSSASHDDSMDCNANSNNPHLIDVSPKRVKCCSSYSSCDVGVVLMEFSGCQSCTAISYKGEDGWTQMCAGIDKVKVKHCPVAQASSFIDPVTLTTSSSHFIHDVIKHWDSENGKEGGELDGCGLLLRGSGDKELMFSIAFEGKPDNDRKVNKCSIKLCEALIELHMSPLHENLFHQLGLMFTLHGDTDDDVIPCHVDDNQVTVITELHGCLQHSAIHYRPLNMEGHAVMTIDSLSLSSTLVTGTPLLVVKLLINEGDLFISNRRHDILQLQDGNITNIT
jgi:hypothetical protein